MSVINNLIRQASASPPPAELTINHSHIGTVAEHMRGCMLSPPPRVLIRIELLAGRVRMMGIPIRVTGLGHG